MKNRFDLIIFDWDGTLVNSIDWITHCLQHAAEQCGIAIPETQATKDVIGLSIQHAIHKLFPGIIDSQTQAQLVACYSQRYNSKPSSPDDLFPGVYEMLVHLKKTGYLLAVATGKSRVGLQKALQGTGTEALFCVTRCADEAASKPDPRMLQEILQHTRVTKERSLMIGDSIHDLQMALNASISSIGVSCGANSAELLQQYNPLLCLQQSTELLNII